MFLPALAVALAALCGCGGGGGGGGGSTPPPTNNPPPDPTPQLPDPAAAPALRDEFAASFRIGAAIEPSQLDDEADRELLLKHYNSLTAENAMKPDTIAPVDPSGGAGYNFEPADRIVDFAIDNEMEVHGHTLVWHRTAPDWFFERPDGMDDVSYRNLVSQRLYDYVFEVVTYYNGRVASWDVVNEVASDTAGVAYRTDSPWYEAFSVGGQDGGEYVRVAFEAARDAAEPGTLLFINDYSTENPAKLANVLEVVEDLQSWGIVVDGVGHQFHLQRTANPEDVRSALETVADLNLLNRVTELDVSIYADPGSCFANGTGCQADYGADFDAVPQSVVAEQATLYRQLFEVFRDFDASLGTVTTWGVHDAHSWLNTWPVTRTNHPLLFDRERLPKAAFWAVVDSTFEIP